MIIYHLKTETEEYQKDYFYVPEKNFFVALCKQFGQTVRMDYSNPAYMQWANDVIENKSNHEIAMRKPRHIRTLDLKDQKFDSSTKGLAELLSNHKEAEI